MRFSLGSVGDLDVTPGATLAECRVTLDAMLGPSAGAELTIGGRPLAPEQVAGVAPWVPGSHVDVGPAGSAPAPDATDPVTVAGAPWHLAVVAGPDAGAVAAPGPDGRLLLGRRRGPDPRWRLALTDPAVSREHAVVHARRRGVVVRDAGSANRTWRLRAGPRRGRRRHGRRATWLPAPRWRRVRAAARLVPGDRLRIGDTELELRRAVAVPDGDRPGGDGRVAASEPPPDPGARAGRVTAAVVPLVLAATLAALTRSPVFLLMAAAGPLVAVVAAVTGRLARLRLPASAGADLGPDAAALSVLLARGVTAGPAWWPLARDGLVVCGDDERYAAAARALVGGALLDPRVAVTVLHDAGRDARWSWLRWSAGRVRRGESVSPGAGVTGMSPTTASGPGRDRHLVLADGHGPWRTDLDRWWLAGATGRGGDDSPDHAVVVVAGPGGARPAWCRWLLTVGPDGRARLTGPGTQHDVVAPAGSLAWAETHARRVAARDVVGAGAGAELPVRVGPAQVGLPDDVAGVLTAWGGQTCGRRALPGLRAPIGLAAGPHGVRPTWVDLLTDGPHALVAGTTGAGKSELLQALVLGLALHHPPAELALVLLDFKGGAGLRACAGLPHVVGHVSDLDPEQAVRALEGLTSELRRREALLAAAGVSDVESLRGPGRHPSSPTAPPRLLVVVDEFRALAEDLPDFVPGLVRLAAQGRSLGMHLILATQRPAGAVTAQMRANLGLRICLRVTEPAESHDVVDVPDAAALPSRAPGRAVVRRADGAAQVVQTTWVALPGGPPALVRRATSWEMPDGPVVGTADPGHADPGHAEALADVAARAAARLTDRGPDPLWSPPLPALVGADEVSDAVGGRGTAVRDEDLVLGVTDPAGAGRRGVLTWDGRGLLVVAGAPGSGRTTAAARAATAALAAGRHVHAVGPVARLLPSTDRCLGTTVDAGDPRRLARLLALLAAPDGPTQPAGAVPRTLLVVDDVASVAAALERMPRGPGADLLDRVVREAGRGTLGVLVTGLPRDVARLAPLAAARLVLPVADPGDDALLGVPRDHSGRRTPGRGVLVTGQEPLRCHVAVPDPGPAGGPPAAGCPAGERGAPVRRTPPVRLAPIPGHVSRTALTAAVAATSRDGRALPGESRRTVVGLGGDDAGPVTVDAGAGLLVVGPAGSGRSTALATLVLGLADVGATVAVVARDSPLATAARAAGLGCAGSAAAAAALVDRVASGGSGIDAIAVDDIDALARTAGDLDDRLAAWVHATERGDPAPTLLAACRTDRAASAYRGAIAALRGAATVVVLSPDEAGSAEAAGADVGAVCDPALPRHPGRGAVVVRGRATPVQVALPD